jgi:hypothetical protein
MEQLLPCPRCGAPRVIAKTWNEDLETANGTSQVKHTLMVCQDADCQAKVDGDIAKQEQKREAAILAKEQRLQRAYQHSHHKKD